LLFLCLYVTPTCKITKNSKIKATGSGQKHEGFANPFEESHYFPDEGLEKGL
jgi:hypothetical protein